jgi:hypothetical protein
MPILLAGTVEFVHIEQVSALLTFRLGQALPFRFLLYTVTSVIRVFIDCAFGSYLHLPGLK